MGNSKPKMLKPATDPEARENQLIAMAYDLSEERLRNKTATGMEIAQWIKLGTSKTRLELEKLKSENELLRAKTAALESAKNQEEAYLAAVEAMRVYQGRDDENIF